MEVDQIQFKFPKINSDYGTVVSAKKLNQGSRPRMGEQHPDEEEEGAPNGSDAVGRFHGWPSSRIVRVPRASAGKDRHSKVITSKGLRDRRVRLSVNTAIQFYDLQDRLGYDQPSKAVEWLLKAAAGSIAELPPMSSLFPDDTPKHLRDEKRSRSDDIGFDSAEVEMGCGGGDDFRHQQQPQVKKSSACGSSPSETSKGSGLSLSRYERCRMKGKGRFAEEERESEGCCRHLSSLNNSNSGQTMTSFTELLSGGFNNSINGSSNRSFNMSTPNNGSNHRNPNRGEESDISRQWPSSSTSIMNHFSSGLMIRPGQMQFMNSFKPLGPSSPLFSNVAEDHHHHSFSFAAPDNFAPAVNGCSDGGSGYNLNFKMSSANSSGGVTAGFNRGTLQSNSSSSLLPHHQVQRFLIHSSGGSPPPPNFLAPAVENHVVHGFLSGLDGRLQLYMSDDAPARNSVQIKGEGKN